MSFYIQPLQDSTEFNAIQKAILKQKFPMQIRGVIDAQKGHLMYALSPEKSKLIITSDDLKVQELYQNMSHFEENVLVYPSRDIIFYSADVHSYEIVMQRLKVIKALLSDTPVTVIATIDSVMDHLMDKLIYEAHRKNLSVGDSVEIEPLIQFLVQIGYERRVQVDGRGQFAVRGGIIDFYSMTEELPYRIEFWDTEIDSIRTFNIETQRSIEKHESVELFPVRELIIYNNQVQSAIAKIQKETEKLLKVFREAKELEHVQNLKRTSETLIEKLNNEGAYNGIESLIHYFYDQTYALVDYFSEASLVYIDDGAKVKLRFETLYLEYSESVENRLSKGYLLPGQSKVVFELNHLMSILQKRGLIELVTFSHRHELFKNQTNFDMTVKSISPINHDYSFLKRVLNDFTVNKYRILLLTPSKFRAERLAKELSDDGIRAIYSDDFERQLVQSEIVVTQGNLTQGFDYPLIKFVIITESDILGKEKKKKKKKYANGNMVKSFNELNVGDYIVHENHGIGVFSGIEKIEIDGIGKDFIKIGYRDNGNLYVLSTQLHMIQKYVGADGKAPKLNKIGTKDWEKATARVKAAAKDMALELIQLYAVRNASVGHRYNKDTVWQKEFEEMFPYEETQDQLEAIEDAKRDMESSKVMDRLVCGDVGYGKTEVAIRVAFKAVQEGKQVAYLVPTTILAQQHYNNFKQRMKDFPIEVEMVSRFRSKKENDETIKRLKRGMVDILIGTHRLLSKDVAYKDLGVLIIDEEQRFGVGHKEKIKQMKQDVDVLTLTATPIPRTLHMSMIGVRDMSILEEPPLERHPIQTYVLEENDELVKDAIKRELSRNGQVYYVNNRVKNIHDVTMKIQGLVPEATVVYAHGQMQEHQLESIMIDFINGDIDVLVATTIIETGLDISNVNTIIIQDADHMGLSQLYQLRGRVGRSNRVAYAYLLYKRDKVLQEVAEKRLKAIREFTEFGAGFKIALRDLEIRGAGNLLGSEQHGHMEAVGYELYCKILDDAIKEKRDIPIKDENVLIDIQVDAFIPSTYIDHEVKKIEAYKKIASIITEEDYFEVQEELEDRYGNIPNTVENLLQIARIKQLARNAGLKEVTQSDFRLIFKIAADAPYHGEKIPMLLEKMGKNFKVQLGTEPEFTYLATQKTSKYIIDLIREIISNICEFLL